MFRRGEAEDRQEHRPIEAKEVRMSDGSSSEVTVIGQGARLEGSVVSAGSLRIDGQVKGKITADGDVSLSSQSQVEADINATNVTVGGKFKGNVNAKARAELSKGGRVDGNITSKMLVVSEGAIFNGQSLMDQPSGQAAAGASGATSGMSTSEPGKADPAKSEEAAKAR